MLAKVMGGAILNIDAYIVEVEADIARRCSMKKEGFAILVAILFILGIPAHAEQDPKEVLKAVVKIRSIIPEYARSASTLGTEREGNGVAIDSQGHILTIGYLIMESETIEVTGPEGKAVSASSVGYDQGTGFGLLKTDKPFNVPPMELGQSSLVEEGDPVLVASFGGLDSVQTVRVISRKEFAGSWEYFLDSAIFTSPPHANFGGAALIDHSGKLVGIGSLFTTIQIPGQGLVSGNMFVPIDLLKPILADLIAKGHSSLPSRPWLGVYVEEFHGRLIVSRVSSEGPAEKAGLKTGDIILRVGKKEVNGLADFYREVWSLGKAGVEVPLSLLQGVL
ncbi:MAG TPA: S1C family serine protease, partial [Thermodesulfobacteriota bacterium]|nr:S1C family serine protease [Thermodesulfobacteriota bacterium]